MQLQLKNIGMIKEANVKIDGLTVIAGENDTGKSTVGKALFLIYHSVFPNKESMDSISQIDTFESPIIKNHLFTNTFFTKSSEIKLIKNDKYSLIKNDGFTYGNLIKKDLKIDSIAFIETPIVWSFLDLFRNIAIVESQYRIEIDYPYLMKDLSFKISIKSNNKNYVDLKDKLIDLMGGEFKKDDVGKFYFDKQNIGRVELVNTATGIKSFGILQMLSQNGWLHKDSILILDEPEVHLHPKWQLEMAKVIVELVKNGVRILVTSHSPYMIEALMRYSELEKQEEKTNFYLAEDGYIKYQDNLENIFEKLALPMRELKKLKLKKYLND